MNLGLKCFEFVCHKESRWKYDYFNKQYFGKKLQLNSVECNFFYPKFNKRGVAIEIRKDSPWKISKMTSGVTLIVHWRVHEHFSLLTTNDFSISSKWCFSWSIFWRNLMHSIYFISPWRWLEAHGVRRSA